MSAPDAIVGFMAPHNPTPEELERSYREAFAAIKIPPGLAIDEKYHAAEAVRAVLARYRLHDPDPRMVETLARNFSGRARHPPGPVLLAVLRSTRAQRGPIAKPINPVAEILAACASELERVGRPWSDAFRDAVLRIADERFPRRNLRRDSRAAAALLKALKNAADVANSSLKGNPNFRWWVERVVRPLLDDEGPALTLYARSFAEPLTVLRQLVMVYDSADFLGVGRPASSRELAAFCLLSGAIPPRGSGRREPSFGDVMRYAQSVVIKARKQAGLLALETNTDSLKFPSPIHRRHVHALAIADLRRAGFL